MDPIEIARTAIKLYAETHPRPPHVNYSQAAVMLNISSATIARMVKAGKLKLNRFGLIPMEEIDNALTVMKSA